MRTVGIIAEYNPFHTGHAYHIAQAKKISGADYAMVIMSPDFVQRGTPAVFDKYTRTQMALQCGADLVIELPVCYASGSAEFFAEGAIALLNRIGVVDTLVFGAEHDDLALFQATADLLLEEPEAYSKMLKAFLKEGFTYPKARSEALIRTLESNTFSCIQNDSGNTQSYLSSFLSSPNNILGIEYCKALKKTKSRIMPIPLLRFGSSYNSTSLDGVFCSASALREGIQREEDMEELLPFIPVSCRPLFLDSLKRTVFADDMLPFIVNKLLTEQSFSHILDISLDLSERIQNLRFPSIGKSFDELSESLKTKQVTKARINRALVHLLLDIRTDAVDSFRQKGTVFYAKVLGFSKNAVSLLHAIKENSDLPFLTKPAKADSLLQGAGLNMWKQDLYASHLYRSVVSCKYHVPFRTEWETSPIILP
ncbi:MAG: nucleotidyltransferase family protein [Lachnospiraceae bacterium]|nr:nucleotidyltransferase family protein [Lachnospiraceae bacterium]MDD7078121.1 nucleotidyltransferase family protein [Lachnospiraceae bacterium]MDY3729638.1 nucleotidyltransferase family protein [Candidatus Choladocola sp.]